MQSESAVEDLIQQPEISAPFRKASMYGVQELDLTLIRATNYTDDGYPIKTRVGVIRSNTLTQMGTLARDLANYPFFSGVKLSVRQIDEAIEQVPMKEIIKRSAIPGVKSIVMLVGVQSNQYPRALDIASWFLPHRIPVLIGGFLWHRWVRAGRPRGIEAVERTAELD